MEFKIPFAISKDLEILKRRSKKFLKFTTAKKSKLNDYLKDSEKDINKRQYLSICYRYFVMNLLSLSVITTTILGITKVASFYFYGVGISLLISGFVLMNQINYPKMHSLKKSKNIEKNLISALQDMLVQLNSGIPLFRILINIADAKYGEVTNAFKKIIKEINAGVPQIDAIELYSKTTTSKYLKRVLWQISNGMRSGSDMSIVIKEGIKSLSEEQAIQIQSYGGKLNPLIMFYMLIAIILPSLGITFLIVISSIMNIGEEIIQFAFAGIFVIVIFIQIMFLGIMKTKRPSLL